MGVGEGGGGGDPGGVSEWVREEGREGGRETETTVSGGSLSPETAPSRREPRAAIRPAPV